MNLLRTAECVILIMAMSIKKMIDYWLRSAEEDLITAESLYKAKRCLPCLFYRHLFVEKIIKAIIVKETSGPPPYGHKLSRLAKLTTVSFSKERLDLLDELTAFNIKARYEDYKFTMYKKATARYTQGYLKKAKELSLWLKEKV